eukprot:6207441-Amphidinium_carterae.1
MESGFAKLQRLGPRCWAQAFRVCCHLVYPFFALVVLATGLIRLMPLRPLPFHTNSPVHDFVCNWSCTHSCVAKRVLSRNANRQQHCPQCIRRLCVTTILGTPAIFAPTTLQGLSNTLRGHGPNCSHDFANGCWRISDDICGLATAESACLQAATTEPNFRFSKLSNSFKTCSQKAT